MRGIILAGGTGSRLHPITLGLAEQLVPVFDKTMIYYALSALLLAGVRDILVITTPEEAPQFERLLGDGSRYGVSISFAQQPNPDGLAQAFLIGEDHLDGGPAALVLDDNIFYRLGLGTQLRRFPEIDGAAVLGYQVADPSAHGGVERSRPLSPSARAELEITVLNGAYLEEVSLHVGLLARESAGLEDRAPQGSHLSNRCRR